jgi:pyridinium-3,5-biscarboxylic acid mononucleotide synthase
VRTLSRFDGFTPSATAAALGSSTGYSQIEAIASHLAARGEGFLATRLEQAASDRLGARFPGVELNSLARTGYLPGSVSPAAGKGTVLVVTAGTSDLPVAEEAAVTLRATGDCVDRLTDVGVAGIHRGLAQRERLLGAAVIIVVAGMDGALASVIGGLVRKPVIAVPTSIGYGAAFHGLAPLLTMLNSCAAGVAVVNIDNGFGAAMAATRITHA